MRNLRKLLRLLPLCLAWFVLSAIFWSWVFTLATDTRPEKKVTLFVSAPAVEDRLLAAELEKGKPSGIRMVKVHPFSYAVFDEGQLSSADLYLVPESRATELLGAFAPIEPPEEATAWYAEGVAYGIRVYDAASGRGVAEKYIRYVPEGEVGEDYYLFFGAGSPHRGRDDAPEKVAAQLLRLE